MAFVRGVGVTPDSVPFIPLFKAMGATAVRTWGLDQLTPALVSAAEAAGLAISAGVWVEATPPSPAEQKALTTSILAELTRHPTASSPAITSFIVGNEVELRSGGMPLADVFSYLNTLGLQVQGATGKPTTAALAGTGFGKVAAASAALGAMPALTINAYAEAASLPQHVRVQGAAQPYVVGEFVTKGPWEVGAHTTEWGAPLEPTSTEKAADTAAAYAAVVGDPACLGAYAFLGAHKYETTPTWFGLVTWDGRLVGDRAWVLQELWGLTAAAEAAVGVAPATPFAATLPPARAALPPPATIAAMQGLPRRLLTAAAVPHCLGITATAGAVGSSSGRRAEPQVVPLPSSSSSGGGVGGTSTVWLPPPASSVAVPQGGVRVSPGSPLLVTLWLAAEAATPSATLGWQGEFYFTDPPGAKEAITLVLDPLSDVSGLAGAGWRLGGTGPYAGTHVVPLTYQLTAPAAPGHYRLTVLVSLVGRYARDLRPLPPRSDEPSNLARTGRILQAAGGGQVATASLPVLVAGGGGGSRALPGLLKPAADHLGRHASSCSVA